MSDRRIAGYAIRFDRPSLDLGGFTEVFAPTSIDRTLASVDVRALSGHDHVRLLGRVSAKTLRLSKDAGGLVFDLWLPDTTDGRDVYELVRRRDLTGASFAFVVVHDGEAWDFASTPPRRTVTDTLIREISLVAWPAYPDSSVHVGETPARAESWRPSVAWRQRQLKTLLAR